ncbi:unnamed protein product [Ilex paraguariensis]|uniref:O-methyltransferase C-terminal domain-containing protein n=1 Tax=Ilex paraguariensis TaxID=185542 RepID=A0ABC8RCP5_9AQUA
MTLYELVDAIPIHHTKAQFIYHLMRILIHSGFFVRQKILESDEEGGYLPTLGLMLKDEPFSVTPLLLAMLDLIMTKPWHHEVFEGFNSRMDVGGGTGTIAKAIVNAFAHLKCIMFDLPHVVVDLKGTKNFSYDGGDTIPPADVVLLKWILHDWSDEESLSILKKCREAIPSKDKGGKVVIIGMIVQNKKGDDESIETQLFFDMLMMILVTSRERNEKEWEKLFFDACFSDYKITLALGLRSVIEVYP